jgi:hypothetical protein
MCHLCAWEDDGQDDAEADEVWCGPNGDYSLTEARLNFARFGTMCPPEDPAGTVWLRPDAATARRLYESLLGITDKKALDEQVLVVKRFVGMATTLAESLNWQPLRYDQRRGAIRDDWWLPHVIWDGTSHGRCPMTPDSAVSEVKKRFDHFQYLCNRLLDKVPQRFGRYPCPACGFPTLDRTSAACGLCGWDKPVVDTDVPDEVGGGPRGDYTLMEAQLDKGVKSSVDFTRYSAYNYQQMKLAAECLIAGIVASKVKGRLDNHFATTSVNKNGCPANASRVNYQITGT